MCAIIDNLGLCIPEKHQEVLHSPPSHHPSRLSLCLSLPHVSLMSLSLSCSITEGPSLRLLQALNEATAQGLFNPEISMIVICPHLISLPSSASPALSSSQKRCREEMAYPSASRTWMPSHLSQPCTPFSPPTLSPPLRLTPPHTAQSRPLSHRSTTPSLPLPFSLCQCPLRPPPNNTIPCLFTVGGLSWRL